MDWNHKVIGVRALVENFPEEGDDCQEVVKAVRSIAEVLRRRRCFNDFSWLDDMQDFESTGDYHDDLEEANSLIASLYDYADGNRIWVE